jgi:hypothetical protein
MAKKGELLSYNTKNKISNSRSGKQAWNKNRSWSEFEKTKMSLGAKKYFNWLGNTDLKKIALRDYATAIELQRLEFYKPAIILYAGLIEMFLTIKLKCRNKDFNELINMAYSKGIIKGHIKDKLHVIRDFRNYVHVSYEISNNFKLSNGLVEFSREACDAILKIK